ncbi:DoxX family protein [Paenibacillus solisilvae]|uniref:DoxX family protein n=1 Tax=Paenibacillus solisilvae TaxID=2486751 RepID=A0ABW0W4J0_9BACL
MVGLGLLLIRLVIGLSFMAHGAQKLFGFDGGGLKVIGAHFEKLGIRPGVTMALLAGLSELIGGAMFALGLLTPLAGVVIAGTMVVGILKVHGPNGYWITKGGYEYCLAILVVAIAVALTGAGQFSLDAILK